MLKIRHFLTLLSSVRHRRKSYFRQHIYGHPYRLDFDFLNDRESRIIR